jgi:hypothetical protein
MDKVAPSRIAPQLPADQVSQVDAIGGAIGSLLRSLPADQRQRLLDELIREHRLIPASRAGKVLGQVVRLIPKTEEFSVDEVKRKVSESGVAADPKAIYNALTYLYVQGKVRRVGYGRYIVNGAAFNGLEDLGGASGSNEDESSGF